MRLTRTVNVVGLLALVLAVLGLAGARAASIGGNPPPEWFSFQELGGWASGTYNPAQVAGRFVAGDFDGDGDDDLAALRVGGTTAYWEVWRVQNYGIVAPAPAEWWSGAGTISAAEVANRVISGDLNDDGKDDVAALAGSGSDATWHVWLSTGSGFVYQSRGWWSSAGYVVDRVDNRLVSGDFDGDGRTDAAALYDYSPATTARWHVWLSTGSGFTYQGSNPGWWQSTAYLTSRVDDRVVAGDFDADGDDDVATMYDYGTSTSTWHVWLSDRSRFDYQGSRPGWWGSSNYVSARVGDRVVAGDFSGDGKHDVATLYDFGTGDSTWHVWFSTGGNFDMQYGLHEGWWSSSTYDSALTEGRVVALNADRNSLADVAALRDRGDHMAYRVNLWLTFPGTRRTVVDAPPPGRNRFEPSHASLAIDDAGNPAIAYHAESCPGGSHCVRDLKLARCDDPHCASSTVTVVDSAGDAGQFVSLALDSRGYPVMSYYEEIDSDLKFARCHDPACASSTIKTLDNAGLVGAYSSIALDAAENPVISYFDRTDDALKLARCHTPTCSNVTVKTLDSSGSVGTFTSLELDDDGYPVIAYSGNGMDELLLLRCHDVACDSSTRWGVDSGGGVGFHVSLELDGAGLPVISYYVGGRRLDLKLARCHTPTCTSVTRTIVASWGDAGYGASLALDGAGNPVISYFRGDLGRSWLARCTNPTCTRRALIALAAWDDGLEGATSVRVGPRGEVGVAYARRRDNTVQYMVAPITVAPPPITPTPTPDRYLPMLVR